MSVSADMSLMDILFDSSEDPVLKFVDERDLFKTDLDGFDVKAELLNDKPGSWAADPEDLLNDILSDEQFSLLGRNMAEEQTTHLDVSISDWKPVTNDGSGIKEVVVGSASSTYSDSGLSSDHVSPDLPHDYEFSPRHFDDEDDHLSSAVSTNSDSSVQQMPMADIKMEPQDMDYMDAVEQEQAILGILPQERHVLTMNKKKVRQTVNISPMMGSNPRSLLLPVNTGNGVRTYKIVNAGNGRKALKALGTFSGSNSMLLKTLRPVGVPLVIKNVKNSNFGKKMKARTVKLPKDLSDDDEDITVVSDSDEDKVKSQYPRLLLSPEEKKLMQKEGVTLPSHYPLTKFEERELKRIRRKIRNKISAQDSRKRKKEYLDGLEDRVKQCTEENLSLLKKIKFLQSQNQSLMAQLKKLQITLARTTTKTAQPATCLMVLMLSVALVMAPNLRLTQNTDSEATEQDVSVPDQALPPIAGRTRSLLSSVSLEECSSTEEEKSTRAEIHDHYSRSSYSSPDPYSDTESLIQKLGSRKSSGASGYDSPLHFFADHDYDPPPSKRNRLHFDDHKIRYDFEPLEKKPVKKEFIIPPLDDEWPPQKINNVLKPKEFLIPDVDDEWAPKHSALIDKIETLTAEVKVNISDSKGTRTVVIHVPKEKK